MSSQKSPPKASPRRNARPPRAAKPGQKATRERQAAQRALAEASGARTARRRRLRTVFVSIGVVILAVATLIAVKVGTGAGGPKSGAKSSAADVATVAALTSVPAATLDAIGEGTVTAYPSHVTGDALVANGKPRVLYVGAEYCPFCAAERWAVIVALSRFGTWGNLEQTTSAAAPEAYPNTASFTFHEALYTSELLSFSGIETQTNQVVNGTYEPLDTLSSADAAIMARYDTSKAIPFLDIGGKYAFTGATYKPEVLTGLTHAQIASALASPDSSVAKAIDGSANVLTATLCQLTSGKPAAVCMSTAVAKAGEALANAG